MKEKLYHLGFDAKAYPDGIKKEELKEKNLGGCDAVIIGSILYNENSVSYKVYSLDGRNNKPLDDSELFSFWTILANKLSQSETLGENRRKYCAAVFEEIRQAVLELTKENSKPMH